MPFYSPLRYPGGKRKLVDFFKTVFEDNDLCDGTYVEPYAGGAAVALGLLLSHYAWKIIINDADRVVYAFWWCVLNDTESFVKRIWDATVTIEEWQKHKSIIRRPADHSLSDLGFAAFFLNRTNRSGIIDGGVIGGQNQNGPYKIEVRFNKEDLIKRIELIALYKSRIQLFNLDAAKLIEKIRPQLNKKTLLYLDPPYFVKGKDLYQNHYRPDDHAHIASLITSIDSPWIVTYDNNPQILDYYEGVSKLFFSLYYSAHVERTKGKEVMFFNLPVPPDCSRFGDGSIYWEPEQDVSLQVSILI